MVPTNNVLSQSVLLFRADASLEIGSGHIMRCLTLADVLSESGATCVFVCRDLAGNLIQTVRAKGYTVHILAEQCDENHTDCSHFGEEPEPPHSSWLGGHWEEDARDTCDIAKQYKPAWLIVDHYALDSRWEEQILDALPKSRLFVIDDLADRTHRSDMLLDQNLGRFAKDYNDLVPEHCRCLIGPEYALLRPEFSSWRHWSLERRKREQTLKHVLISLGGVDRDNVTGHVLDTLSDVVLTARLKITVVMGVSSPWLMHVRSQAAKMQCDIEILVNVSDIARCMAEADLAIGAAGSTSWERCCLGLPTLMVVLAENQKRVAALLDYNGAAISMDWKSKNFNEKLSGYLLRISAEPFLLAQMQKNAAQLVDGMGSSRLVNSIKDFEAT